MFVNHSSGSLLVPENGDFKIMFTKQNISELNVFRIKWEIVQCSVTGSCYDKCYPYWDWPGKSLLNFNWTLSSLICRGWGWERAGWGQGGGEHHLVIWIFDIGTSQSVSTPITVFVSVCATFSHHNKHLISPPAPVSPSLDPPCCVFVILFDKTARPAGGCENVYRGGAEACVTPYCVSLCLLNTICNFSSLTWTQWRPEHWSEQSEKLNPEQKWNIV